MKTMSMLLYAFINLKTHGGGVTHKNVRRGSYITIWQDIFIFSLHNI